MEGMLCCFDAHVSKSCMRANSQVSAVISRQASQPASQRACKQAAEARACDPKHLLFWKKPFFPSKRNDKSHALALQGHAARQVIVGAKLIWGNLHVYVAPYILKTMISAAQQHSLRPGAQYHVRRQQQNLRPEAQ